MPELRYWAAAAHAQRTTHPKKIPGQQLSCCTLLSASPAQKQSRSSSRGAQRSTRTISPPCSASSAANNSPRLTTVGQPTRSRAHATDHARGCCHLCRFNVGKPATQTRRHWETPGRGARLELRVGKGTKAQLTIRRKAHSRLTTEASIDKPARSGERSDTTLLLELTLSIGAKSQ